MHHVLPRGAVPGVVMTSEFGRRPSRGIRRRNRRLIAQARRNYKYPNLSLPKEQEERWETPTTTPVRASAAPPSSSWGGGYGSVSYTVPSRDPWAYRYEVDQKAKNARGDCPTCGDYGEHPLKNFRLSPSGDAIKLRECKDCGAKFSDLPKPGVPPKGPVFEELPDSALRDYHDCPKEGCRTINVVTYVMMSSGTGGQMKACKCHVCGTLFKPGRSATTPPSTLVS